MKLTIDFETRSRKDLKKSSVWAYAEHPTTEVQCLAVKEDDEPARLWVPESRRHHALTAGVPTIEADMIARKIARADTIEAHNAEFETAIWRMICHRRYDWPDLPTEKLRCSAAKAAMHALPRALGNACAALGLPIQKDMKGNALCIKMSKPRKPSKANPSIWIEDFESLKRLYWYCLQDVEAEHALSNALGDLPPAELLIWQLDQRINARGIAVDLPSVDAIITLTEKHVAKLLVEFQTLTGSHVMSPTKVAQFQAWLDEQGVVVSDLTKGSVTAALTTITDPIVRRALEIRQSVGKTSVKKYNALKDRTCVDGRLRSTLVYHGANTGRWAGRGFQPHNLPRQSISDPDLLCDTAAERPEMVEPLWGDPMQIASYALRNMIVAPRGRQLYVADFKSVEAVGTAWIAGEQKILDAFSRGLDIYKVAAMDIFHCSYDEVTKTQRQVGKVAVLALGFGGGKNAFVTMGETYDVIVPVAEAQSIVSAWREANQNIVRFWRQIERAAIEAVKKPGTTTEYHGIRFCVWKKFLCLRLPSSRVLYYFDPIIIKKPMPWDEEDLRDAITFMGVDATTHQWTRQDTYGGKLTENIVQAIARDLCCNSALTVEHYGYSVVLTVHDEVVSETSNDFGSVAEFSNLICQLPPWATGFPLQADAWSGFRYRK